jgi:hypothetical protein
MDEADTYFWFVANSNVWYSFPNNHVLNSLLMWITTHGFGIVQCYDPSARSARRDSLHWYLLFLVPCLSAWPPPFGRRVLEGGLPMANGGRKKQVSESVCEGYPLHKKGF